MTAVQPYRTLSTVLYVLSVLEVIAGLVLVFASGWVLSMAPASLGLPTTGLVMVFLKALGIIAIGIAYLLCVTARDPVRHVAVIDTLVFFLLASALLNAYSIWSLHIGAYFPTNYIIVRIVVAVILAAVLIGLRPKAVSPS